jgi:glycosyltransferase involved in cell wall biosynthesis
MDPLRIVMVMIEPPLPFGNAAARSYYVLLKGLVERGHNVTAFAACSNPQQIAETLALFPSDRYNLHLHEFPDRRGLRASWQTLSRPFSYMFSPDMTSELNAALAEGFDVLHLESVWSGWLGLDHVGRSLLNVQYLFQVDLADGPPRSLTHWKTRILGLPTEKKLVRAYRHQRTCSDRLEHLVRKMNPAADVTTVPLSIDTTLYPFIDDERRSGEPTVTLIGSMAWGPTRSAADRLLRRLWPEIRRAVPKATLSIVGWQARSALAGFLEMPGVSIIENVPDTRPYFECAAMLLYAPARGSGMKIKIQEAMAYGVPVVTTSEGIEGLPAVDGVHAGVCEDDAGLVARTVELLTDLDQQNRQRRAARSLIENHCGAKPTLDAIERLYLRVRESRC